MDYKTYFNDELSNTSTQYFIFDSHGTNPSGMGDVEFTGYVYELNRFGLPKAGDLFVYRRPTSKYEKRFYFYGACKIEKIEVIAGSKVRAVVSKPYQFVDCIYQGDKELESIKWAYKDRPTNDSGEEHWQYMFNQYGMTKITKDDFIALMDIQNTNESSGRTEESLKLETQYYQQIIKGEYSVDYSKEDKISKDSCDRAFARRVKEIYNYQCSIVGSSIKRENLEVARFKNKKSAKLDPKNGICMRRSLVKALNNGWISFDDDYKIIVAPSLEKEDIDKYDKLIKYEGKEIKIKDKSLLPDLKYVRYHRDNVYKG